MKEWFKYEYGFINVDDDNVYLTSTGNWSETKNMEEKSDASIRKHVVKKWINILYLGGWFIVFVSFLIAFYTKSTDLNQAYWRLPLALIGLALIMYKHLRKDMGPKYKIPISKIKKIEFGKEDIFIHFIDPRNEQVFQELVRVAWKGHKVLQKIGDESIVRTELDQLDII